MKESYHIQINAVDREHLERYFKTQNISPDFQRTETDEHNVKRIDYIVHLSKYELLYVRLMMSSGFIKPTFDGIDQLQQGTDQLTQMA